MNAKLIAALAYVLVGIGAYCTGYYEAKEDARLKQQAEQLTEVKKAVETEHKANAELSNKGKDYAEDKKQNAANSAAVVANYGRLYVKPNCPGLPTIGTASAGTDATGTQERRGNVEVDFGGIARKIAKLGEDYDNAVSKIDKLQETLNVYQSVCGIANP